MSSQCPHSVLAVSSQCHHCVLTVSSLCPHNCDWLPCVRAQEHLTAILDIAERHKVPVLADEIYCHQVRCGVAPASAPASVLVL